MEFQLKSVLISDEVDSKCVEILESSGIHVVKNTKLSAQQLKQEIHKYDGLIVRSATKVTGDVIRAGSRLKIIGRAGTGVDNVDVATATSQGVVVMNTPGGNTLSAAEHTCAMILAISRHVSQGAACVRAGLWEEKKRLMGSEVFGKTLAVVGLGRIGREVASRMRAFGMTTIGHDPLVSPDESLQFGVQTVSLDELWSLADYITLHTPLIPQTHHLVNAASLAQCKRGVRIVNCARGGIVDELALLDALNSGQCAAAGLDVFEQEPPTNTTLLEHPLITCTPHLGASTVEAQTRVAVEIAQQFVDFSRQRPPLVGAINARTVSMAMDSAMKPWLLLALSLGKLARHLAENTVTKDSSVTVTTQGDRLKNAAEALSGAVLVQLLPTQSQDSLNLVNSTSFAKSIGLQVKVVSEEASKASTEVEETLTVTLYTESPPGGVAREGARDGVELTIVGGLVDNEPHWLSVNGTHFYQPVRLAGHVIVSRCSPLSSPVALLTVIHEASGCQSTLVQSVVSTNPSTAASDTWWTVHVSTPITSLTTRPPSCSLFTSINF